MNLLVICKVNIIWIFLVGNFQKFGLWNEQTDRFENYTYQHVTEP